MRRQAAVHSFDPWRFTRSIERRSQTEGRWDRIGDFYLYGLAALLLLAFAAGLVGTVREELRSATGAVGDLGLVSQQSALSAVSLLGLLYVARTMIGFGPLGATRAQAAWWFSLPVPRTPVLRRIAARRFLAAFAAGAVAWLPFGLAAGEVSALGYRGPPVVALAGGSTAAGLLVMATAVGAALIQGRVAQRYARPVLAVAAALAVAGFVVEAIVRGTAGVEAVSTGWALLPSSLPLQLSSGALPAGCALVRLGVLLVAVCICWVAVDRRLERLDVSELVRAGSVGAHAAAALETMDYRQVAVALRREPAPAGRRGTRLIALCRGRGAAAVMIAAEAVVLVRSRTVLPRAIVSLVLPGLLMVVDGGNSIALLSAAGAVSAALMVQAAAAPAREAAGFSELFPLSVRMTGMVRSAVPALVLVPWGVMFGLLYGGAVLGAGWPLAVSGMIGAAAGWGLAGAAVKSARRPTDRLGEMFTPGAEVQASSAVLGSLGRGYGLAVVALMPLGLYLATGQLWALPAAVATGGACWWAGVSTQASAL